jgi:uncharacterized spore protein YtfJ
MNAKRIIVVSCGALLLGAGFLAAQAQLEKPLANFDRLVGGLKVGAVVGQPVTVQETVIVPFAKINFGLGAGGGGPMAYGGGMGGKTVPLGVLIIEGENVKVELFPEEEKKQSLLQELLPIILKMLPQMMGDKMPGMTKPSTAGPQAGTAPPALPKGASLANVKSLVSEKKYPEALEMVEALIAKDPANADLHAWKGHVMGNMAQGNPLDMMKYGMGAMQEYEAALQLDPQNADAHFGRGVARMTAPPGFGGDLDGAIQDFEAALTKPTPETYFHLGEAYKKKGLNDKAKEAYQKALALNPNSARAKKALEELR